MLKPLTITLLAASSLMIHTAQADGLDDAISAFINSDDFIVQDAETVDGKLLAAFKPSSAMRPDDNVSALEKALLLIDTLEADLSRVRYMLRYGQIVGDEDGTPLPVSFVTVERYNFGPQTHQAVVEDYGEENAADIEEFGVGPHVAWRIVARPLMGQTAALMEVSRKEISDEDARVADCGGRGCLSWGMLDEAQDWRDTNVEVNVSPRYLKNGADEVATPAFATLEMMLAAGLTSPEGDAPLWNGVEQPEAINGYSPFLFVTIDRDLGQDTNVDAALGQTHLNDDAIEELWYRRSQFPGSPAFWQTTTIERAR